MPKQHIEGGTANVSLIGGDGTKAVTFDHCFQKVPAVIVGLAEALGAGKVGYINATSVTNTGFTVNINSDSALSDIDTMWIALEHRSSEWAALTDS